VNLDATDLALSLPLDVLKDTDGEVHAIAGDQVDRARHQWNQAAER